MFDNNTYSWRLKGKLTKKVKVSSGTPAILLVDDDNYPCAVIDAKYNDNKVKELSLKIVNSCAIVDPNPANYLFKKKSPISDITILKNRVKKIFGGDSIEVIEPLPYGKISDAHKDMLTNEGYIICSIDDIVIHEPLKKGGNHNPLQLLSPTHLSAISTLRNLMGERMVNTLNITHDKSDLRQEAVHKFSVLRRFLNDGFKHRIAPEDQVIIDEYNKLDPDKQAELYASLSKSYYSLEA